jgi:hypothetical protein
MVQDKLKSIISEKIEQTKTLFPKERLNRSKERITAVWKGEKPGDRYPFTLYPLNFEYYNHVHTPEERLILSLDEFLIHGRMQDDFIPSLFPGCLTATIPNMFGAEVIKSKTDYSCLPVITERDDILKLVEPDMGPSTLARQWLNMQEYFLDATEGAFPVHVTDMQGPVDVCSKMWNYSDLFLCALDAPELYHRLLSMVTEAIITFWKAQKELLGENFLGTHLYGWNWVPEGIGITVSADSFVMVSPEFYKKFYSPYLKRLADEFGGVAVHSCGNFPQIIPVLSEEPFLRGLNASQMTLPEMAAAGLGKTLTVTATVDYHDAAESFSASRSTGICADITIHGVWPELEGITPEVPTYKGVVFKPSGEWTDDDWSTVMQKQETLLETAQV